jgi:hypothetical protein
VADTAAAAAAAAVYPSFLQARWGTVAHLTFMVFCLLTNIIVTSMLILGGAAVVNGLTGRCCFQSNMTMICFDNIGDWKYPQPCSHVHIQIVPWCGICKIHPAMQSRRLAADAAGES